MIKWFLRESYWAPSDWGVWSHERLTWLMVSASSDVTWQQFWCWVHLPVSGSEMAFSELWASLVAQTVQNLPAVWETQVQTLSQEDPLEKGKATLSSILAWEIPWTEEPGGLQSLGSQRVRHDLVTEPPPCFSNLRVQNLILKNIVLTGYRRV